MRSAGCRWVGWLPSPLWQWAQASPLSHMSLPAKGRQAGRQAGTSSQSFWSGFLPESEALASPGMFQARRFRSSSCRDCVRSVCPEKRLHGTMILQTLIFWFPGTAEDFKSDRGQSRNKAPSRAQDLCPGAIEGMLNPCGNPLHFPFVSKVQQTGFI